MVPESIPNVTQLISIGTGEDIKGIILGAIGDEGVEQFVERNKIKAVWFGMTDEQRIPFHELREKRQCQRCRATGCLLIF